MQEKNALTNVVIRKYVIRNRISIFDFFSDTFLIFIFYSAITYGDVSYDYIPEIFATLEEQRNNFALDKEKKKYV